MSSHADMHLLSDNQYLREQCSTLRDENQRLREALREPLQPCGDFPSKLEWLAFWLDGMDTILESVNGEPLGRDVQTDLRRWARQWRAAVVEE
jgi:hypothetical protein